LRFFATIRSLPLLILLTGCSRQEHVQAKRDSDPIAVNVVPVEVRKVQRLLESVGTMFPYDESIISAEIDGRVDGIMVDLGDHVANGQVMVHIADEEYRYLLAQQEAQLKQAMERLGLTKETDKIADVRQAPGPRQAQADLFDAEQRYKRLKQLAEAGVMSAADLDQAQARFAAMQAAYETSINTARNLIQTVEQFRAQLDLQRKKLRDAAVHAPFEGFVKERLVTPGQYVRANTPLITLVKIDPIRLRLEVPERMAPWVKNGQIADISVEAFEGRRFSGKIWRISPTVDQTKRTFIVEVLIDNPNGLLKPGSYARARIPTDKIDSIKLVPAKAVSYVYGANKAYVVVNGTIQTREVKLGDRFGESVEIVEGVQAGEQVATSQLNRLDTGVRVRMVAGS
jgi:RND family efflux transporter MFP subunit